MRFIHFSVKGAEYFVNPSQVVDIRRGRTCIIRWKSTDDRCECEQVDDEIDIVELE